MFDHSIKVRENNKYLVTTVLCAFEQSLYANDHCCMLTIVIVLINIGFFLFC